MSIQLATKSKFSSLSSLKKFLHTTKKNTQQNSLDCPGVDQYEFFTLFSLFIAQTVTFTVLAVEILNFQHIFLYIHKTQVYNN